MLNGFMTAVSLGVKASKELDPRSAASVAGSVPRLPSSLLYEAMYISG